MGGRLSARLFAAGGFVNEANVQLLQGVDGDADHRMTLEIVVHDCIPFMDFPGLFRSGAAIRNGK
jgi:hypothetical protein